MYKQFENDIRAWAENEPGVQALVVIGSRAREDHIADKWSDLDLILFVFDQEGWAENDAWLAYFGEVWLSQLRIAGSGMPEWFVIYKGGFKVDFLIAKAKNNLEKALYDCPFDVLVQRGLGILVNKSVWKNGLIQGL